MGKLRPGRMSTPGITEPTEAIARARAGDAEAWGELYRDYAPAIFRLCRRALPTREDAEDATMEIFMKLKVKLVQYVATRSFSAWLYKVAANHCWDLLRRRRIRQDKETDDLENVQLKHLDEMTLLLYIERQLDRARGLEVYAHTQECDTCRTLLRAIERESRLLTRAMLEEDEPLPSRLAQFQERARKTMQWIWGVAFGLAATGAYALYTGYIQPWQQQLEQAGFGGSNLLGLLIFQGAMWKGWQ